MNKDNFERWSMHYDSLLWVVTSIFAAAIGGLLVHQFSKFNYLLSTFGLVITFIPVYFAASFRELMDRANNNIDAETKGILFKNRKFPQWYLFVVIFCALEFLWLSILLSTENNLWRLWLSIIIFITVFIFTIYYARSAKTNKNKYV